MITDMQIFFTHSKMIAHTDSGYTWWLLDTISCPSTHPNSVFTPAAVVSSQQLSSYQHTSVSNRYLAPSGCSENMLTPESNFCIFKQAHPCPSIPCWTSRTLYKDSRCKVIIFVVKYQINYFIFKELKQVFFIIMKLLTKNFSV